MPPRFAVGDSVQTPLGKGVVREVRGHARLVVEIHGRAVVIEEHSAAPLEAVKRTRRAVASVREPASADDALQRPYAPAEVDLHGLTVDEALARAEQALSDAVLADLSELRLIHGRTGGRIKAALHRRLRLISSVRAVRIDPRNAGVTIVTL